MTKRLLLAALLSLAVLSLAFRQSPPRWEYKVEQRGTISEKKLNELGAQGWELTGTVETTHNGSTFELHYIFKRAAR